MPERVAHTVPKRGLHVFAVLVLQLQLLSRVPLGRPASLDSGGAEAQSPPEGGLRSVHGAYATLLYAEEYVIGARVLAYSLKASASKRSERQQFNFGLDRLVAGVLSLCT